MCKTLYFIYKLNNMLKRYEHFTRGGKAWTKWFVTFNEDASDKWQVKNKLRNEYMEGDKAEEANKKTS